MEKNTENVEKKEKEENGDKSKILEQVKLEEQNNNSEKRDRVEDQNEEVVEVVEEEEEEEEEMEPILEYKQVKGDSVVGTHGGFVYVIDCEGNIARKWQSHRAAVTSVAVNTKNEYIVSGGEDGKVILHELFNNERKVVADHKRPVKAVAIEPGYREGEGKIVSGGKLGSLLLHEERRWPLKKRTLVLDENRGTIMEVVWKGKYLASGNEQGVIIYDMDTLVGLTMVERVENSPMTELYPCRISWEQSGRVAITWGQYVQIVELNTVAGKLVAKVVKVIESDKAVIGISVYGQSEERLLGEEEKYMMLVHGGNISKEVEMAVESERGDDADLEDNAPELRVVSKELEEITRDVLMVPGYETVIANQYRLISRQVDALGIGDNRWYVVSPKQIILVKEKTFSQHVEWLISQNQIEKAYKEITEGGSYDATELDVAKKQLEQVGKAYINILLEKRQFQEAAKAIKLILQQLNMHKDWEDYVYQFAAAGEIDKIVDYLPANKTISPIVYELVLGHLLDTDIGKFCKVLDKYDVDLFDAESVELAMLGKLRDNCENIELKRSLAELYDRSGRQDEAVLIYLELQDTGIIERIEKENLVFAVRNHAEAILKYDEKMVESKGINNGNILNRLSTAPGVGLLVRNTAAITPNSVVTQLLTHPKHLHTYLHTLRVKSPDTMPTQYSDLQVELYAEYNSELLLHFLRTANNYDLVKACRICESRDLVNETIYLLGRMGDFRKALALILFELGDINQAISFATEQKDQDLWNDLVRFSTSKDTENNTNSHLNIAGNDQIKAELFLALLTKADKKFVNPIRDLLGKLSDMANDMLVVNNNAHESEVAKRLPNAIKDLISQYQTNHDLGQLGYTSINSDLRSLIIKIYNKSNRGRRIDVENAVCNLCNTALLTTASPYRKAPASGEKIVKFVCNHSFHLSCLIPKKMLDKLDMKTSAPVSLRMNSSSPPFSESDNILNGFRYANQGYDGDQGRLYKLRSLIVNSSYHYASTFECPICCNNTIINNNGFAISVANTDSSVNTNTNAGAGAGAVVVSQSVTSTGGWVIPAKYLPNSNSFNLKAKNTATLADPSVLPDVKPLIL